MKKRLSKLKTKLLNRIFSFNDVEKCFQEIEKRLNEFSESMNPSAESEVSDKDGKTGDIKTTRNTDGSYIFEIRTEEGWRTPVIPGGQSPIKYIEKASNIKKPIVKSLEDVETEDENLGESKAKKVIFDEKNDKFVLPRPDYDSGWLVWDHSERKAADNDDPLIVTHNLNVFPIIVKIYFAPGTDHQGQDTFGNSDIDNLDWFTPITNELGSDYDHGISSYISVTQVKLHAGDNSSHIGSFDGTSSPRVTYIDGWVRVLLWK